MDLINTGTDPWLLEYDACEKVAREIMEQLNLRDNIKISPQSYDTISSKIRIRLKQFSTEVLELNRKLNSASAVDMITPEEKERRKRQVEALQSKEIQLQELFHQRKPNDKKNSDFNQQRSELLEKKNQKFVFADMGTTSWENTRDSGRNGETDVRTVGDMKEEQERLLKEQNEGLENLLKIVTAQTQIAKSINNEVEHHNDLLVDIADGMERVEGRINQSTDMVKTFQKKENIWGYWLVAFLLLVAILGVAFA